MQSYDFFTAGPCTGKNKGESGSVLSLTRHPDYLCRRRPAVIRIDRYSATSFERGETVC